MVFLTSFAEVAVQKRGAAAILEQRPRKAGCDAVQFQDTGLYMVLNPKKVLSVYLIEYITK